jgi:hypothetical protein
MFEKKYQSKGCEKTAVMRRERGCALELKLREWARGGCPHSYFHVPQGMIGGT